MDHGKRGAELNLIVFLRNMKAVSLVLKQLVDRCPPSVASTKLLTRS